MYRRCSCVACGWVAPVLDVVGSGNVVRNLAHPADLLSAWNRWTKQPSKAPLVQKPLVYAGAVVRALLSTVLPLRLQSYLSLKLRW